MGDLAGGGWLRLLERSQKRDGKDEMVVKTARGGGRYLTTTPDRAIFELRGLSDALKLFLVVPLFRAIHSRTVGRARLPAYTYAMCLDNDVEIMRQTLQLASKSKLKACIDDRSPFDFTNEGVRGAFRLQESRHARGKVVIRVGK